MRASRPAPTCSKWRSTRSRPLQRDRHPAHPRDDRDARPAHQADHRDHLQPLARDFRLARRPHPDHRRRLDGRTQLLNETLQVRGREIADSPQHTRPAGGSQQLDQTLSRHRAQGARRGMRRSARSARAHATLGEQIDKTLDPPSALAGSRPGDRPHARRHGNRSHPGDTRPSSNARADHALDQRTQLELGEQHARPAHPAAGADRRRALERAQSEALNTRTQQLAETLGSHTVPASPPPSATGPPSSPAPSTRRARRRATRSTRACAASPT
jgi:hypothetical protein